MNLPDKMQSLDDVDTLPGMIRGAMELNGLTTLSAAARKAKVSTECIRLLLNRGHVPKDKTLLQIARNLKLDPVRMLIAAQKLIIPDLASENILAPVEAAFGKKRIWPISQEQCEYLGKILKPEEIDLFRKYRQITTEGKLQIRGYVDYQYDVCPKRNAGVAQEMPGEEQEPGLCMTGEAAGMEVAETAENRTGIN